MSNKSSKRALQLVWTPLGMTDATDTNTAVSVPAGAVGEVVEFQILKRPLLNSVKGDIGGYGNTSVAPSSETVFTDEVPFGTDDDDLANGEYWLDYITGRGRGKKAASGTTQTFTYSYFKVIVDTEAGSSVTPADNTDPTAGTPVFAQMAAYDGTSKMNLLRAGLTAVTSTLTGFLNTLPWAVYHTTPTTRTNNQGGPFEADAYGNLGVAGTLADGQTNTRNPVLTGGEAQDPTALPTATTAGKIVRFLTDLSRRLIVTLGTTIAGEDLTKDVLKVEQRFSRARATADSLLVTGAGFIHTVTLSPLVAVPTAGLATVYDNTAESGTVLFSEWMFATTPGHSVTLDCTFGTGVYVGFDGTLANVAVGISYRQ